MTEMQNHKDDSASRSGEATSAARDDGGPAFPNRKLVDLGGGASRAELTGGMTLRDYFAANAMQGELASQGRHHVWDDEQLPILVGWSYCIADAMLKARQA